MARRAPRLTVETLSDRIVPAFDLAINGDVATSNVGSVFAAGTTTFTATGSGATLDVADIGTALTVGNVVITTGSGGAQSGEITWVFDGSFDDLSYFGAESRSLILRPSASATGGHVTIDTVTLSFDANLALTIDTTLPAADGDVVLTDFTSVASAGQFTVTAGTGDVHLPGFVSTDSDAVTIAAANIRAGAFSVISAGTDATLTGAVDLSAGGLSLTAGSMPPWPGPWPGPAT